MPQVAADADDTGAAGAASTYEFRWDVAVEGTERRYGQKFMKQWKRVLQAQKMGPLVSAKLSPREARFQLCLAENDPGEANALPARQAEVLAELSHLRWRDAPEQHIHTENAERGGAASNTPGFQGVRVWMTFARHDVETVLGKKPKI